MSARCPECGAPVPAGGSCRDSFHVMLALEAEVPGGPGEVPHFYAVASYGIQHPGSMGFTASTVEGLRSELEAVVLKGKSLVQVRRKVRAGVREAGRVTRREGDAVPHWPVGMWTMTVADVLEGGADEYVVRVEQWARSVVRSLEGVSLATDEFFREPSN